MPAGHTHTTINLAAIPIVSLVIYQQHVVELPVLVSGCVAFALATFFMSPDLDLFNSNPTDHWGILKYIWLPYSKVFHHRGISHSLLFGSLTRIIYLSLVGIIFTCAYWLIKEYLHPMNMDAIESKIDQSKNLYKVLKSNWTLYHSYILATFAGIWLADAHHIISDIIYSSIKGLKRGTHL